LFLVRFFSVCRVAQSAKCYRNWNLKEKKVKKNLHRMPARIVRPIFFRGCAGFLFPMSGLITKIRELAGLIPVLLCPPVGCSSMSELAYELCVVLFLLVISILTLQYLKLVFSRLVFYVHTHFLSPLRNIVFHILINCFFIFSRFPTYIYVLIRKHNRIALPKIKNNSLLIKLHPTCSSIDVNGRLRWKKCNFNNSSVYCAGKYLS
jgi:hypothetical protein